MLANAFALVNLFWKLAVLRLLPTQKLRMQAKVIRVNIQFFRIIRPINTIGNRNPKCFLTIGRVSLSLHQEAKNIKVKISVQHLNRDFLIMRLLQDCLNKARVRKTIILTVHQLF
jgi:hypothetical protein